MILQLLIVILVGLISWYYFKQSRKYAGLEKIKGPKPLHLIGNALEFGTNLSEIFYKQSALIDKYGPLVKYWIGPQLVIMIAAPEYMEKLFPSSVNIDKSYRYNFLKKWLGNGLITSRGEYWRHNRKIITPAFHLKIVQEFSYFINKNAKIFHQILNDKIGEKSVDIKPIVKLFALDVISETAMSKNVNAQIESDSNYVKAVDGILECVLRRMFSGIGQFDFLYKLTSDYREEQQHIKTMKSFTKKVIAERIQERALNKKEPTLKEDEFGRKPKKAFLELLLDLKDEQNVFTDQQIEDEVETFMFAGHDTISTAISFILYELTKHPDVQQRIVDETNEILGNDKNAEINYNSINETKYLEQVIKECMRLYTPAVLIERQLTEEIILDGIKIPKGTVVQTLFTKLHLNEKYFPNPTKFDPERFSPENSKNRRPYAFLPFSAGPRNCIGQRYAMISLKTIIAGVLRKFEVLPAEPHFEPIFSNSGVLSTTNGIHVQFKLR